MRCRNFRTFGIYRGRYSREEIREIDEYAQIFGIELIPCIQTLAHLHNALKWPAAEKIVDTPEHSAGRKRRDICIH